jgi:hypothetical protein
MVVNLLHCHLALRFLRVADVGLSPASARDPDIPSPSLPAHAINVASLRKQVQTPGK